MRRRSLLLVTCASSMICAAFTLAEAGSPVPRGSAPAQHDGRGAERMVELTVDAAPEASPALHLQLLPPVTAMQDGNAALAWMQALLAVPTGEDRDRCVEWLAMERTELARPEVREQLGLTLEHPAVAGTCFGRLRAAARRWSCDWQLDAEADGLLPELGRFRSAARALTLRARIQIADGRLEDALETLQVGIALARDVGSGPTIVHGLVGLACLELVMGEVDAFVAAPGSPNLYWALSDLPHPLIDVRPALRRERVLLDTMLPELELLRRAPGVGTGASEASLRGLIDRIAGIADPDASPRPEDLAAVRVAVAAAAARTYPQAVSHLVDAGHDRADVESMPVTWTALRYALDRYEVQRDEMHKWMALPYADAAAALAVTDARRGGDAGFRLEDIFIELLPRLSSVRATMAAADRRFAALRVVEAVRAHVAAHGTLPTDLAGIALPCPDDPMREMPFRLERDGDALLIEAPAVTTPIRPGSAQEGPLRYRLLFRD